MDEIRNSQYPHLNNLTYLDYTASAPHPQFLPKAHLKLISDNFLANPHSAHGPSLDATAMLDSTRAKILSFFNCPSDYTAILTNNASSAAKLVAESFPFSRRSRLLLSKDNHNSILALRCYAARAGATMSYLPLTETFRHAPTRIPRAKAPSLLAFPGQSNFSGVVHDLSLIPQAQQQGYHVLLDAAALAPTSRLDLSKVSPDFVTISFYKMFGYPTGVGCLLVRNSALSRLRRPAFAGGTVEFVSTVQTAHALLPGALGFEDGTPAFSAIPAVSLGLEYLQRVGMDAIHDYVRFLTRRLLQGLISLRDTGGRVIKIQGPENDDRRGGTVSFDVVVNGRLLDPEVVAAALAERHVCVRAGCFCNPGSAEHARLLSPALVAQCLSKKVMPSNKKEMLGCLKVPLEFVRVSVGLGAVMDDIEQFLDELADFCERVRRDEVPDAIPEMQKDAHTMDKTIFRAFCRLPLCTKPF